MVEKLLPDDDEREVRRRAGERFSIARANAINTYADLERMLGELFAFLLRTDGRRGFIAFSSILNSAARLRAIESLLTLSYGDKYDAFFVSLKSQLGGIDSTRNKIAHWIVLHSHVGGRKFNARKDICLHAHPNMYSNEKLFLHEVLDFTRRTDFYRLLVYYFEVALKHPEGFSLDASTAHWLEAFQQPVVYPPPENHPLYRNRVRR